MISRPFLDRIRADTRQMHLRVETCLDLEGSCATVDGYRKLLARMLAFHAPLEERLSHLDWAGTGVDFESRRKARLLRADLAALGAPSEGLPRAALPQLRSLAAGFGCLYVVEGSTLGGKIILRHVERALGLDAARGASFFASYRADVGPMWRAFGEAATAYCSTGPRVDEAVAAAIDTFEAFERGIGTAPGEPRPTVESA